MNIFRQIIFTYFAGLVLISCSEEQHIDNPDHPIIVSNISEIDKRGMLIEATILNFSQIDSMEQVGFIIASNPIVNALDKSFVLNDFYSQNFSFQYWFNTTEERRYFIRSFAIYNEVLVLGTEVTVLPESYETSPIEIIEISPLMGTDGTEINISHNNPELITDSLHLSMDGKQFTFIRNNDTTIKALVPENLEEGNYSIHLKYIDQEFDLNEVFQVKPPFIEDYSPKKGGPGTVIEVKGNYFGKSPTIFFDRKRPAAVSSTETSISITVPEIDTSGEIKTEVIVGTHKIVEFPFEYVE